MKFPNIYLRIIRNVNDRVLESVDSLFDILDSNFPSNEGYDRMKWALTSDSQFDVSSYYEALRGARGCRCFKILD